MVRRIDHTRDDVGLRPALPRDPMVCLSGELPDFRCPRADPRCDDARVSERRSGVGGDRADVVVVGGGIVGASAAAFLAADGLAVTLVERDGLASGASGANSGVVQHPFDPILAGLYRETVALYRELSKADAGFRLGDAPAGLLYVSRDRGVVSGMAATVRSTFPDLECDLVEGPALRALDPAVAEDLAACRVDIGYPVHPGASTYAYATLAERRGARIRLGRSATLDLHGDSVGGVIIDGRRIAAGAVLVAAGPWTPELISPTGRRVPIAKRWGVVVETEPGGASDAASGPRHVLEEAEIDAEIGGAADAGPGRGQAGTDRRGAGPRGNDGRCGAPDDASDDEVSFSLVPVEGLATVGSTFLAQEPDPAAWMERILVHAASFVPGIADAPIRGVRACARPQCIDGRPLVGRVPGIRGLFVCAGHGPWGISTGPASARLVADQVLGREPRIPAELDPARFLA